MGKKKDEGGAPAYMGLFTSLMTVLLAFFILLVSMADSQDAGFYHGVGSVQNSLGMTGGLGMMAFAKAAGETGVLGVTEESNAKSQLQFHADGEGGTNTTDLENAKQTEPGRYIRIYIPIPFEKGTSKIINGSKLDKYLNNISLSFFATKNDIIVRVYSSDAGSPEENLKLAIKRAQTICNVLQRNGIEFERTTAVGYASDAYFEFEDAVAQQVRQTNQAAYFYFYKKK